MHCFVINVPAICLELNMLKKICLSLLSNAFSQSINPKCVSKLNSLPFSISNLRKNIGSVPDLRIGIKFCFCHKYFWVLLPFHIKTFTAYLITGVQNTNWSVFFLFPYVTFLKYWCYNGIFHSFGLRFLCIRCSEIAVTSV